MKLGAGFRGAMIAQNITWAFALLVILERFTVKLTTSKLAGRFAPALLFFSGGLGFLWFFSDASKVTKGFWDFLMHLPREYTIGDPFSWGNPMEVLFITQRGILLGMPLTLIILHKLWDIFRRPADEGELSKNESRTRLISAACAGLIAGTLPLVHVHSLAALFLVTAILFFVRPQKWLEWIAFGVGVAVIAIPELAWTMSGSASETSKFIGWHFGWDKKEQDNFFWFWFVNTGIFIPLLIAATVLLIMRLREPAAVGEAVVEEKPKKKAKKAKAVETTGRQICRRDRIF